MKKHLSTILLVAVLVVGVGLMAYPSVSDWWNSFHQTRAIASYSDAVAVMDNTDYESSGTTRASTTRPWRKKQIPFLSPRRTSVSTRSV